MTADWKYSPTADAGYARVAEGRVDRTERLDQDRMVDYDAEGRILGYEFLNVSFGVDLSGLAHREALARLFEAHGIRVDAGHADHVRETFRRVPHFRELLRRAQDGGRVVWYEEVLRQNGMGDRAEVPAE